MAIDFIGFAYAATVAAGGIMGYAKAGSIPSLGAGILFGSILSYGAYQASQSPPRYTVQLLATTTLAGVMGMRFYKSGKIMPAGLICIMSTAMLLRTSLKLAGFLEGPQKAMPVE
ncbi:transmembrane protein 14C-like [Chrysoperla carnea]|uniref:transmembrane protein 14C-like n=1 Tax=Chrysoperla carnea TaxID=189513 RepID=UPI001D075402|nr:transmembrane protein 14C-like [Chrysoperla carnea]